MSSVNPTEAYRDYSQQISDFENDADETRKRLKQRSEDREDALERAYNKSLHDQADSYERTINEVKGSAQRTALREREEERADSLETKKTYDRTGRVRANELQENLKQNEATLKEIEHQKALSDQRNESQDKYFDDRTNQVIAAQNEQLDKTIDSVRANANESIAHAKDESDGAAKAYKEQLKRDYTELSKTYVDRIKTDADQTQKFYNDTRIEAGHRKAIEDEGHGQAIHDLSGSYEQKLLDNEMASRQSRTLENTGVRDTIKTLSRFNDQYAKDHANGRAEAFAELENVEHDQRAMVTEAYQTQLDDARRKLVENDHHYNQLNDQNLREHGEQFARLLESTNNENHQAQGMLQNTFEQNRAELELRNKADHALADRHLENQAEQLNAEKDLALSKQTLAYQRQMARGSTSNTAQMKELQEKLQTQRTSSDLNMVSPAAEAKLHQIIEGEYVKRFDAEADRDTERANVMRNQFQKQTAEVINDSLTQRTASERNHAFERQMDRNEFMSHVNDIEQMRQRSVHEAATSTERQKEMMERTFGQTIEGQRREYEGILEATRQDLGQKLQTVRQQADFDAKLNQRAFAAKQNEIIRNYEKQLADQKVEYDARLAEVTAQADKKVRETERRDRLELEAVQKQHEQQATIQEQQQKEHARLVENNHQDEMERLKRSNALLIRQKS